MQLQGSRSQKDPFATTNLQMCFVLLHADGDRSAIRPRCTLHHPPLCNAAVRPHALLHRAAAAAAGVPGTCLPCCATPYGVPRTPPAAAAAAAAAASRGARTSAGQQILKGVCRHLPHVCRFDAHTLGNLQQPNSTSPLLCVGTPDGSFQD
jgi:hypothetical protein